MTTNMNARKREQCYTLPDRRLVSFKEGKSSVSNPDRRIVCLGSSRAKVRLSLVDYGSSEESEEDKVKSKAWTDHNANVIHPETNVGEKRKLLQCEHSAVYISMAGNKKKCTKNELQKQYSQASVTTEHDENSNTCQWPKLKVSDIPLPPEYISNDSSVKSIVDTPKRMKARPILGRSNSFDSQPQKFNDTKKIALFIKEQPPSRTVIHPRIINKKKNKPLCSSPSPQSQYDVTQPQSNTSPFWSTASPTSQLNSPLYGYHSPPSPVIVTTHTQINTSVYCNPSPSHNKAVGQGHSTFSIQSSKSTPALYKTVGQGHSTFSDQNSNSSPAFYKTVGQGHSTFSMQNSTSPPAFCKSVGQGHSTFSIQSSNSTPALYKTVGQGHSTFSNQNSNSSPALSTTEGQGHPTSSIQTTPCKASTSYAPSTESAYITPSQIYMPSSLLPPRLRFLQNSCLINKDKASSLPSFNAEWKKWFKQTSDSYRVKYIDSHCHLDLLLQRTQFSGSWDKYRSVNAETFPDMYEGCVAVFCFPTSFKADGIWQDIADCEGVWMTFGCHPKNATEFTPAAEAGLYYCLTQKKTVALGEIGLDYSGTFRQHEQVQKSVLVKQITMALDLKKPLVIHCRDADDDCFKIISQMVPKNYKIHCHCFTGDYAMAKRWLETFPNLYIGLTPLVTYRMAAATHNVARFIPLERLLLETDAPYFVPRKVPKDEMLHSHPGMAVTVAEQVAYIKGCTVQEVLVACRQNTREMYGI